MQADAAAAAIAIDTQTCKAGEGGRGREVGQGRGSRSIKTKSELESQLKRHYRVLATTPPNAAKPFICLSARSKTSARGVARGEVGEHSLDDGSDFRKTAKYSNENLCLHYEFLYSVAFA